MSVVTFTGLSGPGTLDSSWRGGERDNELNMKIDKPDERVVKTERGMTLREVLSLPVTINVTTAASALGMGPNKAYEAIKAGTFPLDLIVVSGTRRVLTASLWRLLQVDGLVMDS